MPDNGFGAKARPGEFGVGDPFSLPLQSVEGLEVLGGERLLIANDNNYPGSDGRWIARDRPDDVGLIVVRAPALRQAPRVRRTDEFVARGRVGSERYAAQARR